MAKTFSSSQALRFGWKVSQQKIRFFVPVVALTILIPALVNRIFLVNFIVNGVMTLGLIKISLAFADGRTPRLQELFWAVREPRWLLRYLLAEALYLVLVGVGLFLLVVPGIYWAIKYGFFAYALADGESDIFAAFRASERATEGVKINLVLFSLLAGLVVLVGVLALLVGLFWAIPTVSVALAVIYRQLTKN